MSEASPLQRKLIKQAVEKLRRLGFTNATEENIATDDIYKFYLNKILLLNLGRNKENDRIIHKLLEKIRGSAEDKK